MSEKVRTLIGTHFRPGGKSDWMERVLREYVRRNPHAVVAVFRRGELFVEKPVAGEEIGLPALPGPKDPA